MKSQLFASLLGSWLMIACIVGIGPAQAHVGDHMPDSVAEMEYRILLEFKPNEFATRIKLAMVLMNQNKLAEAEIEFNLALAKSPRNLSAHFGLSQLKLKQKKTAAALEIIKKALEIAPENPTVYLNYGRILEADNLPEKASQIYKIGLKKWDINHKYPEAAEDRQQLYQALRNIRNKQNQK